MEIYQIYLHIFQEILLRVNNYNTGSCKTLTLYLTNVM